MPRFLKSKAREHDWELAAKLASRIADGEDPVRTIVGSLAKARSRGVFETLRALGYTTDHLYEDVPASPFNDTDPRWEETPIMEDRF
jgi:hypothetical protein